MKKQSKKKKKKEDQAKFLLPEEVCRLDLIYAEKQLSTKNKDFKELEIQLVKKQHVILAYKLKDLTQQAHELTEETRRQDAEHERIINTIRTRLGISGRFGYNPDTLEVTR